MDLILKPLEPGVDHTLGKKSSRELWSGIDKLCEPDLDPPIRHLLPSQRLQYACLMDALHNLFGNKDDAKSEAANWMAQSEDHPFSFLSCCESLGLNPQAVRVAIKNTRWESKQKRYLVQLM